MKEHFPNIVQNKTVSEGCSKYRPDFRIECFTHTVIVENDENSHSHKGYSCENKRMMSIFQDLGNRPLIFIRFNPDAYMDGAVKIKGCFRLNQQNKLVVDEETFNKRFEELLKEINCSINSVPEKEVHVKYLFYNTDMDHEQDNSVT